MNNKTEKILAAQLDGIIESCAIMKETDRITAVGILIDKLTKIKKDMMEQAAEEENESMEECIIARKSKKTYRSANTAPTIAVEAEKERSRSTEKGDDASRIKVKRTQATKDIETETTRTQTLLDYTSNVTFSIKTAEIDAPWETKSKPERTAARMFTVSCSMIHRYNTSTRLPVEAFMKLKKYSEYAKRLCSQSDYADQSRKFMQETTADHWNEANRFILNTTAPEKGLVIVANYTHFFNGRVNGTPDAFFVRKDRSIAGVLEYKQSKEGLSKENRHAAIRQLRGYRYLFDYKVFGVLYEYSDLNTLGSCSNDKSTKEDFDVEVENALANIACFHKAHRMLMNCVDK